jgi:hypothetical protein
MAACSYISLSRIQILRVKRLCDDVLTRQCPCLGLSIHGESMGAGGFDGFRQKHDAHESLPTFGPPEDKDLHPDLVLLVYLELLQ